MSGDQLFLERCTCIQKSSGCWYFLSTVAVLPGLTWCGSAGCSIPSSRGAVSVRNHTCASSYHPLMLSPPTPSSKYPSTLPPPQTVSTPQLSIPPPQAVSTPQLSPPTPNIKYPSTLSPTPNSKYPSTLSPHPKQ